MCPALSTVHVYMKSRDVSKHSWLRTEDRISRLADGCLALLIGMCLDVTACGMYVIPATETMTRVVNPIVLKIICKQVRGYRCSLSHLESQFGSKSKA